MIITIAGTQRQASQVVTGSLTIVDALNSHDSGSTATLQVRGFTPSVGDDVKIYLGSTPVTPIFGGTVTQKEQIALGKPANVAWNLTIPDYVYLLTRRLVFKNYPSQSATAVAQDLISSFTSGFTSTHVQASLASVAITFAGATLADALTQLAGLVGGGCRWFIDPNKDLYLFTTDARTQPATVTAANVRAFVATTDLSKVVTRVYVKGPTTGVSNGAEISATIVPIDDARAFDAAGGSALAGAQKLTYTGANGAGIVVAPVGAITATHNATPGALTASGVYKYRTSYNTVWGETAPGLDETSYTADGTGTDTVNIGAFPVPTDPQVTSKNLLRTKANGAVFYYVPAFRNTVNSYVSGGVDGAADSGLVTLAPTFGYAGAFTGVGSTLNGNVSTGATSIAVIETKNFYAAGGAAAFNGQIITYTGRSTTSGNGNLTGIPASGRGSVVLAGVTGQGITSVPALTGVSGIVSQIAMGDAIASLVQRDDATAQTALAALEGGDGIHEILLEDASPTIAGLNAVGDAELTLFKTAETRVTFFSRDPNFAAGVTATIAIGAPTSVTVSLPVQQVTLAAFDEATAIALTPWRRIDAAPTRLTLTDLLALIPRGRAA